MGTNNRQRRAAKRHERARRGPTPGSGPAGSRSRLGQDREPLASDPSELARRAAVLEVIRRALDAAHRDPGAPIRYAQELLAPDSGLSPDTVRSVLTDIGPRFVGMVIGAGWTPADLGHLVRRRLTDRHVELVAAMLTDEVARHPDDTIAPRWRAELAELGSARRADVGTVAGVAILLDLCAAIETLPRIAEVMPPPGAARRRPTSATTRAPRDAQRLAKVRALLAKAESTEFAEEAEVLSAKAQELISRYALERLLQDPEPSTGQSAAERVLLRRIWIDPPYVSAKVLLVHYVAQANRCRAVSAAQIGFSSVLGVDSDLESVELLVTSLLVQASAAMLRHGSQISRYGVSQTASFRRSFLQAYAGRIGERLRAATEQATEATGRAQELVPVLADRERRVNAARDQHFPRLTVAETRISNESGWVAGRVAADLARLDIRPLVKD